MLELPSGRSRVWKATFPAGLIDGALNVLNCVVGEMLGATSLVRATVSIVPPAARRM